MSILLVFIQFCLHFLGFVFVKCTWYCILYLLLFYFSAVPNIRNLSDIVKETLEAKRAPIAELLHYIIFNSHPLSISVTLNLLYKHS